MTIDEAMQLALEDQRARRIHDADVLYTEILKVAPTYVPAIQQLGCLAFEVGRFDIAIDLFSKAAAQEPQSPAHPSNLGEALRALGRNDEAVKAFKRSIALNANDWVPYKNLGLCLVLMGRLSEAVDAFENMRIKQTPNNAEGHFLKGYALLEMGEQGQALALIRRALEIDPMLAAAQSHLFIALNHDDEGNPEKVFESYLRAYPKQPSTPALGVSAKVGAQKIRVGFVSADFRRHSCAYFLEPLFTHYDRNKFEFFAYATGNHRDEVTQRFQAQLSGFHNLTPLLDEQAIAQIKTDKIDVLVDLMGHTPGNRISLFAAKPAAKQVAWLGYPNTTGLPQMDCRISDAIADPIGMTEHLHSEKVLRLDDCFICYGKLSEIPAVAPLPALKNGFITFGSFGRLAKLTPHMIEVWSNILLKIPSSRLLLKSFGLADEATCQAVRARFAKHGIATERLTLRGFRDSLQNHLMDYSEVDIALDTFPYHGTTTTCEALQMGVPVISLAGKTHVARVGASLLAQVGLKDWVATSDAQFEHIALEKASDIKALETLRRQLRQRFESSPLADGIGFTRKFEKMLEAL